MPKYGHEIEMYTVEQGERETSGNNTTTYERATKFRREIQMCIA